MYDLHNIPDPPKEFEDILLEKIKKYLNEIEENILSYRTLNYMTNIRARWFELRIIKSENSIITFMWRFVKIPNNISDILDIYDLYVMEDNYINGQYFGSNTLLKKTKDSFEEILNSIFPIATTTTLRFVD